MTRILHLFDAGADWEQRVGVTQLLDRLDRDRFEHRLASIHRSRPVPNWFNGRIIIRAPVRLDLPWTAAPRLSRLMESFEIDVVHAWGTRAALAASAARPRRCGLVVERFDPFLTRVEAKALRTIAERGRFAVACATATVSRRLVERGLPADQCVVIRPGVDFKRINEAKRDASIRRHVGCAPDDRLAVASHPVDRRGGHQYVVWSGHLQKYVDPARCMVLYGDTRECRRLQRLSENLPPPDAVRWVGAQVRYEELIAVADALVITPFDDVSTTAIAWAMAASVPVIGSAVYSVAEMIAHRHNGYLIKPERTPATTMKIAAALDRTGDMLKEREVARGQAYEVFSVRRYADQHARLYENVVAGRPPGDGITDTALVN